MKAGPTSSAPRESEPTEGKAGQSQAEMESVLIDGFREMIAGAQQQASPELVALVEKERELHQRSNADAENEALFEEWNSAAEAAEAFTPRNLADVALMIRLFLCGA